MSKKKKLPPLSPAQLAMLKRLEGYSAEKPFLPSTGGESQTIFSLDSRKLLDGRMVIAKVELIGGERYTTGKRAVWLKPIVDPNRQGDVDAGGVAER